MRRTGGLLFSAASCVGASALAQTAPPLAPPTREEIERQPVVPTPEARGPRVSVESGVERAPCPLADPRFATIRVTLNRADFAGLGPIPSESLTPAWSDFVGREVQIAAICDIRDRAATLLRARGYLAAVQVPAQQIEDGVVRFDVLLAKLVGLQVRGDVGPGESVIARHLRAVERQPVVNVIEAERALLLTRDLPGYDVRLTLRPAGTVAGEVIGEVRVVRTPVELDVNLQNYGSRAVGRWGGIAQLRLNGLLGLGDRTTLGFFSTSDFREQIVVQAGQTLRIGGNGLSFGIDANYAWTRPSVGPGLDLRSRTLAGTARFAYPLLRRQTRDVFLSGGLDLVNQTTRLATLPLSRDRLRVAFARADFNAFDADSLDSMNWSPAEPRWRTFGGLEVRQGVDLFGASNGCGPAPFAACTAAGAVPPSRIEADPTAFVVRANAALDLRPLPRLLVTVQPRAQYSNSVLFNYEQISFGNYTVGRGYDPGSLLGDSGIGLRAEVAYGSLLPGATRVIALQPYAFADAGRAWGRDITGRAIGGQSLRAAGGGVRATVSNKAQLDAGFAVPLTRLLNQAERPDTRFLLTLTTRLLPWRR